MRYKATSPFARPGTPPRPSARIRRPRRGSAPPDRLRDLVATAPILLLLAILIVGDPARAAVPAISYVGTASAGARIDVVGTAFGADMDLQLRWDRDERSMPKVRVGAEGGFAVSVRIPNHAAPGDHELSATPLATGGRSARGDDVQVVASVIVTVLTSAASPASPTPQAPLPATPTAVPSSSPTGTPTPTHEHSTPVPAVSPPATTPQPTSAATPPPHHPGPAPDPVACTGYPEPRVFLESQGWWVQTPGRDGTDFGHVHVGMCFPHAQRLGGTVTLDVRLTVHSNPGTLTRLYGGISSGAGDFDLWNTPIGLTCTDATCVTWTQLKVDTTRVPVDGRAEWRFRPQVRTPDGKDFTPSTGWQTYLANGNRPHADYRSRDEATGRGWYDGAGYANASIMSIPLAPISTTWSANVILDRGHDGIPVTSHGIYLDPDFHHGSAGTVIREGSGPYRGPVTIDASELSPGVHRLVLRADANDQSGSTNSGLLVIFFTVER
jgi:hypothetical protein